MLISFLSHQVMSSQVEKEYPTCTIYTLLVNNLKEKDWKRDDIFWTTAKCSGKSCKVVIDDACPHYIVAKDVVDKLQLVANEVH